MTQSDPQSFKPEILAPAGDMASFLAAYAAGADAVYLGLKHFSARATAENFGPNELSKMVELANKHGKKIFVAFNSLAKPGELAQAGRLITRLARDVKPHALIMQDPGLVDIARQAGFEGEIHFSTLANVTHTKALEVCAKLGVQRAILPRELSVDEVVQVCENAPEGMGLELFVHGALCYCVSGRCYWSSFLGGKSGLRGRCVQPCRRVYTQKNREGRFFSCQDLSLDVLVRTLLRLPNLVSWKIEGRKKGPHYVYHTVAAYKLLRDEGTDPRARKDAEALLEMALGRPTTHAGFLPQRKIAVTTPNEPTSSGTLIGTIQFEKAEQSKQPAPKEKKGRTPFIPGKPCIKVRQELLPKDFLRIGYEDESWHTTLPVTRRVPKAGTLFLNLSKGKMPLKGTPVFLIDRKEPELMATIREWQKKLDACKGTTSMEVAFTPKLPTPLKGVKKQLEIHVRSTLPQGKETRAARASRMGLWFSKGTVRAVSRTVMPRVSWWLPPVIWPDEEDSMLALVREALRDGASQFILNAPWQTALFEGPHKPELVAGPFCNVSNAATVALLKRLGFSAAFVNPELNKEDFLALPAQSCLPLAAVIGGWWPVGISRQELEIVKPNEPFRSPMREPFWARRYGENVWIYPAWQLDLSAQRAEMEAAGYAFFATLDETIPPALKEMPPVRKSGTFNWDVPLL